MIAGLAAVAVALGGMLLLFGPLEWAFPAWRGQPRLRRGVVTDLAFFLGQHLVFSSLVVAILAAVLEPLRSFAPLEVVREPFAQMPVLWRGVVALVLGDLLIYWGHRLQHRSEWLWRFHGVHHTAERLDFLAAHREHPIDGIYTRLLVNLPAIALGLPFAEIMGLITFRGLWATFIHANVRIPVGPLRMLIGSPRLHHQHHALSRNAGNYANLAPWIDWVFGTYRCPPRSPDRVGTDEPWPQTYLGLLVHPFRRRRR
jgi:sterol desaturase/sphingolipid hydroxylase (fatty acid hydroxylase superfamily)